MLEHKGHIVGHLIKSPRDSRRDIYAASFVFILRINAMEKQLHLHKKYFIQYFPKRYYKVSAFKLIYFSHPLLYIRFLKKYNKVIKNVTQ